MYRKESEGWFKHIDFIIIDMICLQVAFCLAYVLRRLGINPFYLLLLIAIATFSHVKYLQYTFYRIFIS